MSLVQQISDDIKTAMKGGDKARLETLRFVFAGLQAAEKEKGLKEAGAKLSDDEAIAVLQKEAKRRKESIELFKQGKRDDLVRKEEADLAVIMAYLPKELSRGDIAAMVDAARATGANDFSSIMRETMKQVKGRADGKLVGEIIKEKLGGA